VITVEIFGLFRQLLHWLAFFLALSSERRTTPMGPWKGEKPRANKAHHMTVIAPGNCTSAVTNARDANALIRLPVNYTSACRSESPAERPSVNSAIGQKQTRRRVER